MADDEIAVTIEDVPVTPAGGEGAAAAEPVDDLKAQVAELKAGRQREADRAANAERAAALARNQAQEAHARVATVSKQAAEREGESIDTGITAATDAIAAAKKEIRAAGEAGDYAALADAPDERRLALVRCSREGADAASHRNWPT